MDWMQIFVLTLLLISGFFTVWFRDLLCSVICSGAFSLLQLAAVGVFILLYLAGSVISTAIIGRTKLMELFAVRE